MSTAIDTDTMMACTGPRGGGIAGTTVHRFCVLSQQHRVIDNSNKITSRVAGNGIGGEKGRRKTAMERVTASTSQLHVDDCKLFKTIQCSEGGIVEA